MIRAHQMRHDTRDCRRHGSAREECLALGKGRKALVHDGATEVLRVASVELGIHADEEQLAHRA